MAPNAYVAVATSEKMDAEKGQLEQTSPVYILAAEPEKRSCRKGRALIRILALVFGFFFAAHALKAMHHRCVSSFFGHEDNVNAWVLASETFEVDPATVNAIDVSVTGAVLAKIKTELSEHSNIAVSFKALSKNPAIQANITLTHEVDAEGTLRIVVESGTSDNYTSIEADDVVVDLIMYLPQSNTKDGTNLKIVAPKAGVYCGDLTNLALGTVDVNVNSGAITVKGAKAQVFILGVQNGGVNGAFYDYLSFSAEAENGAINIDQLRSNQNGPTNVRLAVKTGGISVNKVEFAQNYVNVVDVSTQNGGVKLFVRDSFHGDFEVKTEVGALKVSADTSGLEITDNIRTPTGGVIEGTFRKSGSLEDGTINVSVGVGAADVKFTSNGF